VDGVLGAASIWPDLEAATTENLRLRAALREAELRLLEQRAAVEENARLRSALDLQGRLPIATIVADVVARDAAPWFRSISIDKGSRHGVAPGATVLTAAGVLGRVVSASDHLSQVQLLMDRDSGVAVLTERSRVDGVAAGRGVEGAGENLLLMKYVPALADVKEGDIVVTSGLDGLFQKGLVIGAVRSIAAPTGLFKDVYIQASAAPALAEQVFVSVPGAPAPTPAPRPRRPAAPARPSPAADPPRGPFAP
jgi:rod shape-determining protein MreC